MPELRSKDKVPKAPGMEKFQEMIKGPTPGGGDYAIAYFMDVAGNPTTKDKALTVEIWEYKDGKPIKQTLGIVKGNP